MRSDLTPPFPPQFFILLGIDIFLGGSILTVTFDELFPGGLPYMLDFGALVGFIQLLLVPQYLTGYPEEMQFYYCVSYTVVAVMAIAGLNLYVVLVRHERKIGMVFAGAATLPAFLCTVFFVSALLNGIPVSMPTIPLLPWPVVWGAFIGASGLMLAGMAAVRVRRRRL